MRVWPPYSYRLGLSHAVLAGALLSIGACDADSNAEIPVAEARCSYAEPALTEIEHPLIDGVTYSTALDSEPIPIVFGPQSAWMYVFRVRTNQLPNGTARITLEAEFLSSAGQSAGRIVLERVKVAPDFEGLCVSAQQFIVLATDDSWEGTPQEFHVKLTAPDGVVVTSKVDVFPTKSPINTR